MSYDKKNNLYAADGHVNVRVCKNKKVRTLSCQHVEYDKHRGIFKARDHIQLTDELGNKNFSQKACITQDFSSAEMSPILLKTIHQERFQGTLLKRVDGYKTTVFNGSYTACQTCNNEDAFWQIEASEVVHNDIDKTIEYHDAVLRFSSVPVLYVPYFSHPDPSVKRKSGFLFPQLGYRSTIGYYLAPVYFYEIDKTSDITISTYGFTKDAPILSTEYNQAFHNGFWQLSTSIHQRRNSRTISHIPKNRWHAFSDFEYDINATQRLKVNIHRASDDTYLEHYPLFLNKTYSLTSLIEFENFATSSYFKAQSVLYTTNNQKTTPIVLPKLYLEKKFTPTIGYIDTTFMMDHFNRRLGVPGLNARKMTRLHAHASWSHDYLYHGQLITPFVGIDGRSFIFKDYNNIPLNDLALIEKNQKHNHKAKMYLQPTASLFWRYPLISWQQHFSYVFEPQAKIIVSPYCHQEDLPNDDALFFTYDDTVLFLENRSQGYSRFDSGSRFVYGFDQSFTFADGSYISWFIGQTRFLSQTTRTDASDKITKKSSDLVQCLKYVPSDWFKIRYQSSIDLSLKKERFREIGLTIGKPIFLFEAGYVYAKNPNGQLRVSQLNWSASSKINANWSTSIGEVRNFKSTERSALRQYANVKWQNDCFSFNTYFYKTKIVKKDIRPDMGFMIEIEMKNIGKISPLSTEKYEKSPLSQF
ncbi:MAG: LPS-assembly protein LptD [Holosporales bacterium]